MEPARPSHPLPRAPPALSPPSELFDQDLRPAAAAVVAVAADGWQVVGVAQAEAALLQEIVERLRGQAEQLGRALGAGPGFGVLHQLGADALVLVFRVNADAGQ